MTFWNQDGNNGTPNDKTPSYRPPPLIVDLHGKPNEIKFLIRVKNILTLGAKK